MKITTLFSLLLAGVLASGCILTPNTTTGTVIITYPLINTVPDTTPEAQIKCCVTPSPTPQPTPEYTPVLRPYKINKEHDIWRAQDPSSYITPDNAWVKYYASQVYIDDSGDIRYKNTKTPDIKWEKDGQNYIIYGKDVLLGNNYISDNRYPDGDMWVMPDYYLTNGMSDDCDGWALAVSSMMLSGQISIKNNDRFEKQVIPAKVMLGYVDRQGIRDIWVEYNINGQTYITTTKISGRQSLTIFALKEKRGDMRPIFEFTDKYFRSVI